MTLTRDRQPCTPWDSNPQSQQASGRRPTPYRRYMFTSIPDAGKIILITNETSVTVLTLCITVSLCLLCPARLLWTRENNTNPPDHWLAGGVYCVAPTVSLYITVAIMCPWQWSWDQNMPRRKNKIILFCIWTI